MSPVAVLITVAAYFVVLFTVAYFAGRKADNQGFFVGNRKSPWFIVALAMIGSSISGVTFISVPGWVEVNNFSYLQMVLGFVVGQFIIAFVLIPLFYRMQLVSIYEYLQRRFGTSSYKTGAWFFIISKMLGAAVRIFLVCIVMQFLVFDPLGVSFIWNVALTMVIVWLYTFQGGVKSLIWTDTLKTFCLIVSVGLCIYYIAADLDLSFGSMFRAVADSELSRTFFFDDVNDKRFFFKQFLAGVFTVIATMGLDQDMMQRNLSCKNHRDSQKNIITSGIMQFFIIALFLMLGVLLSAAKLYAPEAYRKEARKHRYLLISVAGMAALYGWYLADLWDHFDDSNLGRILIFTLVPVLCCLLVAYLENSPLPEKLRGTFLEKGISGISSIGYSVYLVHYIVFQMVAPYFEGTGFLVSWLGFGLAIGISLVISYLTYRLIEQPLTRFRDFLLRLTA